MPYTRWSPNFTPLKTHQSEIDTHTPCPRCRCRPDQEPLQPRGDVDPIAINALLIEDHVSLVDPNPELHTPLWFDSGIPFGHRFLDSHGAFDHVQHAGEFGHNPIASSGNDSAAIASDHRENDTLVAFEVTDCCD